MHRFILDIDGEQLRYLNTRLHCCLVMNPHEPIFTECVPHWHGGHLTKFPVPQKIRGRLEIKMTGRKRIW